MPANRVYAPADRPEIQVLIDGTWHEGDLHAWQARGDEQWAQVVYSAPDGTRSDTVPADHVRKAGLTDQHHAILAFSERNFPDDETRDAALRAELQVSPARYQLQLNWIRQQLALEAETPQ